MAFKREIKNKSRGKKGNDRNDIKPGVRSKLPPVLVLEVTAISEHGEPFAVPIVWEDSRREPPRILLLDGGKGQAPSVGQRVLAKMQPGGQKHYQAQIIRVLPEAAARRILGVYQPLKQGGVLRPVSRKQKQDFYIPAEDCINLQAGDLVMAELQPRHRNKTLGMPEARLVENLGDATSPRTFSLIAIHHNEIPTEFSVAALAEAQASAEISAEGRIDLRDIPLVTIDGKDARDFDDAVFAEPDGDGWHLIVAIADVAHYVTPDSALDQEAFNRGNSVYFPDRVVPMLPEALSNGLCSLMPKQDRYCLAAHLWITAEGVLDRYQFVRGIMHSHARLIYEQVQQAWDSQNEDWLPILTPLYGAYKSLLKHRAERGALELDMPEYEISIGDDGKVASVKKRERVDSHKLIEEFMICANVAAADAIEHHGTDGIFRIHEPPSPMRVEELRNFLRTLEHTLAADARAKQYNKLLSSVEGKPESALINTAVLRSQTQAYYSDTNKGHFGLGLEKYCHFTSPIRRYSDLVVHRALIALLSLNGKKVKKTPESQTSLTSIAEHISQTERRAMQAEREANDRYITAYLAKQLRAEFAGVITSVGNFGLFVTLNDTGASGIIRMSELGRDFYMYDERHHSLIGRDTGERFQLGQRVVVTLIAADITLGTLRFALLEAQKLPPLPKIPYKRKGKEFQKSHERPHDKGHGKDRYERREKTNGPRAERSEEERPKGKHGYYSKSRDDDRKPRGKSAYRDGSRSGSDKPRGSKEGGYRGKTTGSDAPHRKSGGGKKFSKKQPRKG